MSRTTEYITLYLEEKMDEDIDTRMFIIYDDDEEMFYLYGTRTPVLNSLNEYVNYRYNYSASRINALTELISFITNKLHNPFTIGLYNMVIDNEDINDLDFKYLNSQLERYNEIVCYDNNILDKHELKRVLNMLISY